MSRILVAGMRHVVATEESVGKGMEDRGRILVWWEEWVGRLGFIFWVGRVV